MTTEQAAALAAVSGNVGQRDDCEAKLKAANKEIARLRETIIKIKDGSGTKTVEVWRVEFADRKGVPDIKGWQTEAEATAWYNYHVGEKFFTHLKLTGPFKQDVPG